MVRRSGSETREAIAVAARRLFGEHGYAATSVRDIAALASADPALVIRHFESKELLFLETMTVPLNAEPQLDVPVERLGATLVDYVTSTDQSVRVVYLALVRGSSVSAIADKLRSVHEDLFVAPVRERLATTMDLGVADLRARTAGSVLAGLLYSMWVVEDAVIRDSSPAELHAVYGPLLQQALTPR
ncbi:TetR/AcrR family transcriptional regulator [Rhodococcoides yunnanense]|uniref:TetR/AcrR family transcriptional regulator n=1 Tax=Rhodococcoides yunnanense TaxID=278209 RepID=UPI0009351650|nr:TetR/AcrR family transcriptional regulator [Rhodococcus yunnanensis]